VVFNGSQWIATGIEGTHCSVGHKHPSYILNVGRVSLGYIQISHYLTFHLFNSRNELEGVGSNTRSRFGCGCDGAPDIEGIHCSIGHTHLSYILKGGKVSLGHIESSYHLTFHSFNSRNELEGGRFNAHSRFGCGCDGAQDIEEIHCGVGHTHLSYILKGGTVSLGCTMSTSKDDINSEEVADGGRLIMSHGQEGEFPIGCEKRIRNRSR
jgi:hypothetical protein